MKLLLILAAVLLGACASHTGPKTNSEFAEIANARQLSGSYQNKGDPSGYLSEILWDQIEIDVAGKKTRLSHKEIDLIQVAVVDDKLSVNAIANKCVVYKKEYLSGRDFEITDGKIIFRTKIDPLSRGAGDIVVGPSYSRFELGLDTAGHGKYRQEIYQAGLVLWLVPIAGSVTADIRFLRVDDGKVFEPCKNR